MGLFSLLALSKEIASAGVANAAGSRSQASLLWTAYDYAWMLGQSVFCIGAVMFYYLLFVSKRIPRWLSVWGLIAAPLMLIGGLLARRHRRPELDVLQVLYAADLPAGDGRSRYG